ncbi:MAG: Ig-like domain-containing protein, partial [Patescibacteria group bacterium]
AIIQETKLPDETFPILTDTSRRILIRPSQRTIDISSKVVTDITTPYVIFFDDDGDEVPNDLEKLYGTDPERVDSDSDGFTDATELRNGFDPLQSDGAKLTIALSPTERALADKVTIEQPLAKGEVDPAFKVLKVESAKKSEKPAYTLTGTATPDSIVFIFLYSEMPLVLAVQTDEFGNWVYTLDSDLVDGKHVAYVSVTDETGKITKKSEPFSFFVRRAQAVSPTSFLADEAVVTSQTDSFVRYYIFGGIGIAFAGFIIFLAYILRKNRHAAQ